MTQLGSAYGEIRIGTGQAERSVKGLADQMTSFGSKFSLGVSTPLIAAGAAGIKAAANFQSTMNVIQTVAGATADQMAAMSQKALQLGKDTSFSAGEAADGMLELAKAGMTADQTMASIGGVLDLAAAGGLSVAQAAEISANALNAFKLSADDAGRVADLLAASANASSIEVTDMAQSFQASASVFASNKQSIEDLSTAIAILGNNGIKGSDAGTSLKTMMMRLAAPTKEASKQLGDLGVQVYNADGSMRTFEDIVKNLSESTTGLSDAQRNAAFNTIFGADAIRAANILVGAGAAEWNAMETAVTKAGAAQEVAQARMKGLRGAIEYIKGTIESTLTGAFLPLDQMLGDTVRRIADLIAKFAELPRPIIDAALAFGAVLAVAGPLMLALPTIAGAIAALASPIGAIVLAMAGLAAAWAADWGGIQEKTRIAIDTIKEIINNLWTGVTTGDWQPLMQSLSALKLSLMSWFRTTKDNIKNWFQEWWNQFTGTNISTDGIAAGLSAIKLHIKSWQRVVKDDIRWWWFDAWNNFSQSEIGSGILDSLQNLKTRMLIQFRILKDETELALLQVKWAIVLTVKDWWSAIVDAFGGDTTALIENINGLKTSIGEKLTEIKTTIGTIVGEWWSQFANTAFGSELIDRAQDLKTRMLIQFRILRDELVMSMLITKWEIIAKVKEWAAAFSGWVDEVWPGLKTNLTTMLTDLTNWIGLQKLTLQTRLLEWKSRFTDWTGEIWAELKPTLDQMLTDLKNWIGLQKLTLQTRLLEWKTRFVDWVMPIWAQLQPKLVELGTNILDWVREQGPKIERETAKWKESFEEWIPKKEETERAIEPAGQNIYDSILGLQEKISQGFGYMIGAAIGGAIRYITEGIYLFVAGIIGSINDAFANPKNEQEVGNGFWGMIGGMLNNVPKAFGAVAVGFWDQLKAALGSAPANLLEEEWVKLGENLRQVWTEQMENVKRITDNAGRGISQAWTDMTTSVGRSAEALRTSLGNTWRSIQLNASQTWAAMWMSAAQWWVEIRNKIVEWANNAKNALAPIWNAIQVAAEAVFGAIAAAITGLVTAKDNVVQAFSDLKTFVAGLTFNDPFAQLRSWISGVARAAQGAIDKINALRGAQGPIYDSSGTTSSGSIGRAMGDHWWQGGLAWVGERGPELVDIPRGARIYDNTTSKQMAGEARVVMNITNIVNSPMDMEMQAHRMFQIAQRYN